jgi:hypothetical protein
MGLDPGAAFAQGYRGPSHVGSAAFLYHRNYFLGAVLVHQSDRSCRQRNAPRFDSVAEFFVSGQRFFLCTSKEGSSFISYVVLEKPANA